MANGDSVRTTNADYAPNAVAAGGTSEMPVEARSAAAPRRRFRPHLWPTLAMLALAPLFIAAGQWQWNKAATKARVQAERDARERDAPLAIPATLADAESLRYRRVVARGRFEPAYQVLIDNRIYRGQPGYQVVTPLRLEGSATRVLVDRGWIPATGDRSALPQFDTPEKTVDVAGMATVPGTYFFTLGKDETGSSGGAWQRVWQNLDVARYRREAPFATQPVVIQLDPGSTAGGFVREWPRADDRRETNLGYALQWWTFAGITVALWLGLNVRRAT